jgi:hypothetical protein
MHAIIWAVAIFAGNLFKSRRRLEAENLLLRHQLNIALRQSPARLRLRSMDRVILAGLVRFWPDLARAVRVVKPDTILRWYRMVFRAYWRWKSRKRAGRPLVPTYLIRDNDQAYGRVFTERVGAMGIRDRPTAPRSPWQNGIAERLIGTLRHECLDHVVVFGERHLRCVLSTYAAYYNQMRPHRSLHKDAPMLRAMQRIGHIASIPILGGLHHQYVRI